MPEFPERAGAPLRIVSDQQPLPPLNSEQGNSSGDDYVHVASDGRIRSDDGRDVRRIGGSSFCTGSHHQGTFALAGFRFSHGAIRACSGTVRRPSPSAPKAGMRLPLLTSRAATPHSRERRRADHAGAGVNGDRVALLRRRSSS